MKRYFLLSILIALVSSLSAQPSVDDSLDVQGFMDGVFKTILNEKKIVGATVVLIKDGRIRYLEGHGYSDYENLVPVDPENTLFRIGSISKTFVWTAIMQLYEKGRISLDDNIEEYLDFDIPDTYSEPITIKHLMTHTPGFEDHILNLFAKDSSSIRPLEDILQEQIPKRVMPPGQYASYSNHGTGMAALIVEKVSGMDFNRYVEKNILDPLDMKMTTFDQPLPSNLKGLMSKGYNYENSENVEKEFEYVPLAPVGGASTTASDMVNFMSTHLQLGRFDNKMILDSTTAQLMQSPAFRHAEQVNPMLYGFYEMSQNNIRIFGHGGDTFWFHSLMALFPEEQMGLFMSFNSQTGGGAYDKVLELFVDRYFPEDIRDLEPVDKDSLEIYCGKYAANRYSHDDFFKISRLMVIAEVSTDDQGILEITAMNEKNHYFKVKNDIFRNRNTSDNIVFERDMEGNITTFFYDGLPIMAMEKLSVIESPEFHLALFAISLSIVIITFIYWLIFWIDKRRLNADEIPVKLLPGKAKILAWVICLAVLFFYIGFLLSNTDPFAMVYGLSGFTKFLLHVPYLIMILILWMGWYTFRIWVRSKVSLFNRIYYLILLLTFISTLWQWNYWNLIGT